MKFVGLIGVFFLVSAVWAAGNASFEVFNCTWEGPGTQGVKQESSEPGNATINYYEEVFGSQRPSSWIGNTVLEWTGSILVRLSMWIEFPEVGVFFIDLFLLPVRFILTVTMAAIAVAGLGIAIAFTLFIGLIEELVVTGYFFVRPFSGAFHYVFVFIELFYYFLIDMVVVSRSNIPTD